MRKAFLAIALVLLCAFNAQATVYYFDLASGNDTTGDGSYGNPWKTIDKCSTGRTGGDECRGAKSTITTLSGTLTFTNGSTTVNTSQDLSGAVAAGDFIGKNTGVDAWWVVASATSTTITITNQYWAPTGSGDAVTGYKITPIAASEQYDVNCDGSSGNRIKISGGWDLSTQTQTGVTAFNAYSTTHGVALNNDDWIEFSHFVIRATGATGSPISHSGGDNCYFHDIWIAESTTYRAVNLVAAFNTYENIYISESGSYSFYVSGNNNNFKNVYVYSPGNANNEYGFYLASGFNTFENLRIYNSYDDNLYIGTDLGFNLFKDCHFITNRNASSNNITISASAPENRFFNTTASGSTGYVVENGSYYGTNYFVNNNFTAGSSGTYIPGSTSYDVIAAPTLATQETGGDAVRYYGTRGTITSDSSASARSGKALKYTPLSAGFYIGERVGTVKITSTSSDITLGVYVKDDGSFNGAPYAVVVRNGKWLSKTAITPTTSYAQVTFTAAAADLVLGDYLDLWILTDASAGNFWVDDFSASQ